MPATAKLYIGNDNRILIEGLLNKAASTYLNSATVTVTLVDSTGAQVSGQSWPTTMSYIAASDGDYAGTLEDALSLTEHAWYTAQVTANGGAGLLGYWELAVQAKVRED